MSASISDSLMPLESSSDILITLLLCGLMGLLGQGVRAAIGLKNALATPAGTPVPQGRFNGAYFATSLMIGFIAGDLAGVGIGLDRLTHFNTGNMNVLIGIAAAGYAGVDFIENTFSNVVPFISRRPSGPSDAGPEPTGPGRSRLHAALEVVAPGLDTALWVPALAAAFDAFDLHTDRRIAAAIGQFLVEAGASFQHAKRGLIPLPNRNAYTEFGNAIDLTAEQASAYCEAPAGAAMGGCWFFASRGCLALADEWAISRITRRIAGTRMPASQARAAYAAAMLEALQSDPGAPVTPIAWSRAPRTGSS